MRNADGTLRVADHKCIMTLRTSAYADVSSWTKIWEAATIATGMCSTQGKKGLYSQIGESLFGGKKIVSMDHGVTAFAGASKRLYLEVAADVGDDETS